VYVCKKEREGGRKRVRITERVEGREGGGREIECVCTCVCVCEKEGERVIKSGKDREKGDERETVKKYVCVCV